MDKLNRPLFAYDRLIHENCYRRPHFDAGRFAKEYGDYNALPKEEDIELHLTKIDFLPK